MCKPNGLFALMLSLFVFLTFTFSSYAQNNIVSPDDAKVLPASQSLKNQNKKQKKGVFSERKKRIKGYAKYDEPDMFVEFQKMIRTRDGETAPKYSANYLMEELDKSQKQSRLYKTNALNWIERGPGNVSGRTRGIIVDPADVTNKTWFAGSVGGGIWKTINAGLSWTNQTPDLPNLSTTVLAQAASNLDVIYCGTGEGFFNADAVNGSGIFKSIDHGNTWIQLTATANFNFRNVNRIIVDPTNPNIVLACTTPGPSSSSNPGGVHRSSDGGNTWTRVFNSGSSRTEDLKADPLDFSIQYCTVRDDGVYKSTDGGLNWTRSSNGLTTDGRIEIAVSGKNTNYVYASCEETNNTSSLYVSEDKGGTWLLINSNDGVEQNWLKSQGWYDNTIAVHPFDEKTVFFGGIDLWKATIQSGSASTTSRNAIFSHVTDGYSAYQSQTPKPARVHVDHHSIIPVPLISSPGTFWIVNGNDGGVAVSTDGGLNWREALNGGYNTTQFYGIDKKPGANEYFGGTQDNGTWFSPSGQNASKTSAYKEAFGGDGFDVSWHHSDPNKMIGSSQNNGLGRSTDGGLSWRYATTGLDDVGGGKGPFISKIAESNSDPEVLFTTGISGIWRSEDFGGLWTKSTITGNTTWSYNSISTPVTISIADPQIVWAGNHFSNVTSRLFLSTDGGITFSGISPFSGVSLGNITGIDTHPTEKNTAFITYSISGAPKIIRTTDLGNTWQDITGFGVSSTSSTGFPNVATYCVLVMPYNTNIIWAGTEIGLFESTDNGANWHSANNGLQSVCIWKMKIVDDQVVLATHGRGIFSVTIPELSGYQPPVVILPPTITTFSQLPDNSIKLAAKFRSGYDSIFVMINDIKVSKLSSTSVKDTIFNFTPSTFGTTTAQLFAYKSSRIYKSSIYTVELVSLQSAKTTYANNFDDSGSTTTDFSGNGFTIATPTNFTSSMVNSPHPYEVTTDYYYNLLVPIKISNSIGMTNIEYDDIALVEPGDDGSVFGDSNFWDFVAVEGSNDGSTWIPFEDGYDCRFNSSWSTLFNNNTDPTASNYVHHKIDMTKKFNPGDVIFIRFHFRSDDAVVGWGWAFDNLKIQDGASTIEKEETLPADYNLSQNFPNPFNPVTTIKFSLPQRSRVKLEIFDALGRVVSMLVDSDLEAGTYRYNWDASGLASGVYIYRITANDFISSRKLILVK